jgi:hypothetical protein
MANHPHLPPAPMPTQTKIAHNINPLPQRITFKNAAYRQLLLNLADLNEKTHHQYKALHNKTPHKV